MGNFLKLVYNEQLKLYVRKSTWIMYGIIAILTIGIATLTLTFDDPVTSYSDDNWESQLQKENDVLTKEGKDDEYMASFNNSIIATNNYYLEHDIQPEGYGAFQFTLDNVGLLSLVSLFTIIIAAGIVASEFRLGTIKLLLIRPISRSKLLLSKYVSVLLFALITLLALLFFSYIVGALFFGFDGINPSIVMEKSSGLEYVSILGEIVSGYGYGLVNLVMMATFAFMISSVFRNSSLAIGIAIFLMMAGNSIVGFFSNYDWVKYILFANTDLQVYADGNSHWIDGMSLGFSITMLAVYYAIFMVLSWTFFTKRDVTGH
ncbi:ABC transporter permease [Ornithinibacillus contaminans]|uniref:ABC transporter permease n=1 Tax=Ornithinibacillus contaminans TaxID=694055 RepID=UPI00064DAB80|nr:ABC transporter permease subunit [Ornithinibacillus contaminans]